MNGTNSSLPTKSIGVAGNIIACSGFQSRNVFPMFDIQPIFRSVLVPLLGQAPYRRGNVAIMEACMAKKGNLERRKFLKTGMLASAAAMVRPGAAAAQSASQDGAVPATERDAPSQIDVLTTDNRCGSDYMVDVIKSLGFEYVCAN